MNDLLVTAIQRHCVYDGPGVRTVVFLQGCFLRCPWCCNPEMQSVKRNEKNCDVDELYSILVKDEYLYEISNGGVTFSGGEPLLQTDGLLALVKRLHDAHIHVAIETALFARKDSVEVFLPYVDLWLIDLKFQFGYVIDSDSPISMDDLMENIYFLKSNVFEKVSFRMVFMRECLENANKILCKLKELKISELTLLSYHSLAKSKYEKIGRRFVEFTNPSKDDFAQIISQLNPIKVNRLEV